MQIEVEKLEGLERKLKVVLPSDKFTKAYEERLLEIAKKSRLPGFRPGKAPISVVEKKIGKTLLQEVASELMQSGFQQAVVDNKLRIAGTPEVKSGDIAKGQPLEFEVIYESYPEIELADFSQVEVERLTAEIAETDVDKALARIQRQQAKWHEVDRPAKENDRIVIDFDGFIDKKPFPGGNAKDQELELGSHEMIPGFEEGLIGVVAGESRDLNLTFPENYPLANLANQTVLFKVTVHKVKEPELLPLDDEFAKKIGAKTAMTLQDLRQQAKEGLQKELTRCERALVKKQVLDKLLDQHEVEAPQSMINDEIKHLQDITRQQVMIQQGRRIDPKNIELPKDPYIAPAKRRVILGLLIAELIKKYELKLNKDNARKRVEEIVAGFPNPEEMANYYQSNKRLMSEIEASVLEEQVVDKLVELAQVHDRKISFDDLIKEARLISE